MITFYTPSALAISFSDDPSLFSQRDDLHQCECTDGRVICLHKEEAVKFVPKLGVILAPDPFFDILQNLLTSGIGLSTVP